MAQIPARNPVSDATAPKARSLYVHVPLCSTKCGYCDFYSIPLASRTPAPLLDALLAELGIRRNQLDTSLTTVFVGGGTPTVLPNPDLARLFAAIAELTREGNTAEFTVEANPATLTDENAHLLRRAGVNRISLGAQSFEGCELAVLERTHTPDDIPAGVAIARRAGFEQLNLDLIFGIPGQTLRSWQSSIERALELEPDHLACYGLTYEPGTPLTEKRDRGRIAPCEQELEADMMLACRQRLQAAGFDHYEISNYARPNARCLHNLRYWKNFPYVGIGPSAAGFLNNQRYKNVPDLDRYITMIDRKGSAVIESETLDPPRRAGETAMLRLRLLEGIDVPEFQAQTGFDPLDLFKDPVRRFSADGLLAVSETSVRLTEKGLLLADEIMADFLDAAGPD